ncbi:MAG: hypothetical protein ACRD1O_04485 [Terriglobia bacterium]
MFLGMLLLVVALWSACGGGAGGSSVTTITTPGTPPGTYGITITAATTAAPGQPSLSHQVSVFVQVYQCPPATCGPPEP